MKASFSFSTNSRISKIYPEISRKKKIMSLKFDLFIMVSFRTVEKFPRVAFAPFASFCRSGLSGFGHPRIPPNQGDTFGGNICPNCPTYAYTVYILPLGDIQSNKSMNLIEWAGFGCIQHSLTTVVENKFSTCLE